MIEFAAWKNIAADRGRGGCIPPAAAAKALEALRAQRDRMMKIEPARLQQAIDGLEVGRMVGIADLLEHADRGDLVEAALDRA